MGAHKVHCLILPYPIQGHINPLLQFSKRLRHEGAKVTVAATQFLFKTFQEVSGSISVETISDGFDEGRNSAVVSTETYLAMFQKVGSKTLTELVLKLHDLGCPVDCIVYDAFLPWGLDVAKSLGLCGAVFFTQSCAVNYIYYHVHKGLLKLPLEDTEVEVPGLPLLASELPSFVSNYGSYPAVFNLVVHDQMTNIEKADWIFFNTFHKLEEEALSLGVPMVAMPQWTDQSTNSKFVMDTWKMGIKAQADENGIVRRDEILHCISQVMEGQKGQEIRTNANKWRDLARQAADADGNSDINIKEFVSKLIHP